MSKSLDDLVKASLDEDNRQNQLKEEKAADLFSKIQDEIKKEEVSSEEEAIDNSSGEIFRAAYETEGIIDKDRNGYISDEEMSASKKSDEIERILEEEDNKVLKEESKTLKEDLGKEDFGDISI